MTARIGNSHRIVTRKDGRTVLVQVKKRYDLSTELKRATSKKVTVVRKGSR
jgi:hypothetical protein